MLPVLLFSPLPPADILPLHVVSETELVITVGWTPPPNAVGYRFRKDQGKWSHTWDGSRNTVRFSKPYSRLEVEALTAGPKGDLP